MFNSSAHYERAKEGKANSKNHAQTKPKKKSYTKILIPHGQLWLASEASGKQLRKQHVKD